jgi:Nuclease-related domain
VSTMQAIDATTAATWADPDLTDRDPTDRDLAANVAGAAARSRAVALRQAAPVKTALARLLGVKTDERNWRIGADAEVEVGRRLAGLGERWRVIHAIPVGDRDSDIDHLVIGPSGVYSINTKNHPDAHVWIRGDTVKVNGHKQPYVRNSRHEARRAARLLSTRAFLEVNVQGVIAVMGARRGFTVRSQPAGGDVVVTSRKQVVGYLKSRPVTLEEPSVERIYEAARHLSTWQPSTVSWSDFG